MSQTVVVLRPFVYTYPPKGTRHKLATEKPIRPRQDPQTKAWIPTPIDLEDEIWADPWISEHFADGCIERPERTLARAGLEQARKQKELEDAQRIVDQANAAFRRATGQALVNEEQGRKAQLDLDTPVNELRAKQGADLDTPPPEASKTKQS